MAACMIEMAILPPSSVQMYILKWNDVYCRWLLPFNAGKFSYNPPIQSWVGLFEKKKSSCPLPSLNTNFNQGNLDKL